MKMPENQSATSKQRTLQSDLPTVSVIIPTYNHRDHILHALDSVFSQSFEDYEVIVVNDGSPDDTGDVLRPLSDARKIRYLEQPNAGQAAARNRGIAEAQGEFIALLDDDDLWPQDKLAWQTAELRSDPAMCMIAGTARAFAGANQEIAIWGKAQAEVTTATLYEANPITSPGQTLIRRSALDAIGGLRQGIWGADDWDLYFRLARRGKIVIRNRIALHYRTHETNASHNTVRMIVNCLKVMRDNLSDNPPAERRRLMLVGMKSVLQLYGGALAGKWKDAIQRGAWRAAAICLLTLGRFWRVFVAEPKLFVIMLVHFCPESVRDFIRPWRSQSALGQKP